MLDACPQKPILHLISTIFSSCNTESVEFLLDGKAPISLPQILTPLTRFASSPTVTTSFGYSSYSSVCSSLDTANSNDCLNTDKTLHQNRFGVRVFSRLSARGEHGRIFVTVHVVGKPFVAFWTLPTNVTSLSLFAFEFGMNIVDALL